LAGLAFVRPYPPMRPLSLLLIAVLALAASPDAGAAPTVASAKKEGTRVSRAAKNAHTRLDAKLKAKGLAFGDEVLIRVFKEEEQLELWLRHDEKFELLKTYAVCAASGKLGPKQKVGDEQVPEGFYAVPPGAMNPESSYHLSFNVGYPNAFDKKLGRTGSLIMIHGDCVSIGCVAMTDEGIQEIWSLADAAHKHGQKAFEVHIFPFRMTSANMKRHRASKWIDFWENLKEGFDSFESSKLPPKVGVKSGRYTFSDDH
jgi:murein L,D-transpeptidase YafK